MVGLAVLMAMVAVVVMQCRAGRTPNQTRCSGAMCPLACQRWADDWWSCMVWACAWQAQWQMLQGRAAGRLWAAMKADVHARARFHCRR